MIDRLIWERDGKDWPNREASRFVSAGGLRWHVQEALTSTPPPERARVLIVHGTGASTHSWADLFPLLARRFDVLAFDLPGHAFTEMPAGEGMTLPGMAALVRSLVASVDFTPDIAIGHSAGAAILARLCLDGGIAPRQLIALNGALLPFGGIGRLILSPLAKLMARSSLIPELFARRCDDEGPVLRLLEGTGSKLPPRQVALYRRLMSCRSHAAAGLAMMAGWDLDALARDLPRLATPLVLVAGGNDRTISPEQAFRVRDLIPSANVVYLRGLGHLMHEEKPAEIAGVIERCADGEPLGSPVR